MFVVRNSGRGVESRTNRACTYKFVIGFSRDDVDAFYALLEGEGLTDEQEARADSMLAVFDKVGGERFIAPRENT